MQVGFRILQRLRIAGPEFVAGFAEIPVANVSDAMRRMFAGGPSLRPMHLSGRLVGPAVTVRTRPGDNLMFHKALDVALPGDVIVVDGGGGLTNALCGELMVAYAVRRQIAGFVVNGAIRDSSAIARGDFPVFAAGVTHRGPYKDGPGEINSAIAIDGMVIEPGDLILGDEDGFVCVPYGDLDSVFKVAQSKHAEEAAQMLEIAAGKSSRTWIDAKLTNLGCEF